MKKYLFLIILIAGFVSFFRLGSVTLFDVDEAVFAQAAKEMIESADWITPTYNGENRYDKPILFYWLMAASYKAFGINEFAARFPSALSGVLLVLSVFLFVRHFRDDKEAFYASIPLALSIYFFMYSHAAVTDMSLSLFITLSLFSFFISINKNKNYIYGFYICSALAFLTKGLIGIVFPFGIALVYLFATERVHGIKRVFHLKAALIFLILALPWYTAEYMANGQEFIRQFFIKHHFTRYAGVISGHKGPVYYYIPVIIAGLFPWIAFLPAGIATVVKEIKSLKSDKNPLAVHDNPGLFLLIWFGFIFLFFSFSTTKLPNYILSAIPAASILISAGMYSDKGYSSIGISGRRNGFANVFIAIASILTGIAFIFSRAYLAKMEVYDVAWTYYSALLMFALASGSLYALFTKRKYYGYISAVMAVFLCLMSIKALPAANRYLQGALYQYSLYAGKKLGNDDKIIAYGMNNPSIVFYSGHKIISVRGKEKLMPYMSNAGTLIAIAKAKDIDTLKDSGFNILETNGRYALLERK